MIFDDFGWFWMILEYFGIFWNILDDVWWFLMIFDDFWWLLVLVDCGCWYSRPWDPLSRSTPHAPIVLQLPPDRSHWTCGRPWKLRSRPWCATWRPVQVWSNFSRKLMCEFKDFGVPKIRKQKIQKGLDSNWNTHSTKKQNRPTFWHQYHHMKMTKLGSHSQSMLPFWFIDS